MPGSRTLKRPERRAFLPVCRADLAARGWDELDILLVSGDAYVDHPAFGIPLLARLLEAEGYRVGLLAQPDWRNPEALRVLGRPRLFAAVSAGAMDSMVNHYTAAKRLRSDDAYTPGGKSGARPNRALIAYTAALKGAFKGLPVVIGGIEASLRRLAHYDYWDDAVRRSVLVDSKADLLVYGMGEAPLLEIARRAAAGEPPSVQHDVRGTAWLAPQSPAAAVELPDFDRVASDRQAFATAFRLAEAEANPGCARALTQRYGQRWLVVNPPSLPLSESQLDQVYALPFTRLPHPDYRDPIPAYEQIRFSVTTHRGCCGGCAFCAIGQHQGKIIQSRSETSILAEIDRLTQHPEFRGTVSDIGGPSANMYGLFCGAADRGAGCRRSGCLYPHPCPHLRCSDRRAVQLLEKIRALPGVRHAYVASGVRFDLMKMQPDYFAALLEHHVGGLLKVAPETVVPEVARAMRKPGPGVFLDFLAAFREQIAHSGRRLAVVPYFVSAHPGCTLNDMVEVALFLKRHRLRVEQVQEFTPTPGTLATCVYHCGIDPFSGATVHVPRSAEERRLQKALLLWHLPELRQDVLEALRRCRRTEVQRELFGGEEKDRPVRLR